MCRVVAELSSKLDSSSGVSNQQSVGSSPGLDSCVIKQGTWPLLLRPSKVWKAIVLRVHKACKNPVHLLREEVLPGVFDMVGCSATNKLFKKPSKNNVCLSLLEWVFKLLFSKKALSITIQTSYHLLTQLTIVFYFCIELSVYALFVILPLQIRDFNA